MTSKNLSVWKNKGRKWKFPCKEQRIYSNFYLFSNLIHTLNVSQRRTLLSWSEPCTLHFPGERPCLSTTAYSIYVSIKKKPSCEHAGLAKTKVYEGKTKIVCLFNLIKTALFACIVSPSDLASILLQRGGRQQRQKEKVWELTPRRGQ